MKVLSKSIVDTILEIGMSDKTSRDKDPRIEEIEDRQFSLHKMKGEKEKSHRAFLLWAMQSTSKRQASAVGRAIGVSHTQIGNYRKQYRWDERATRPTDEVEAYHLYKKLYVPSRGMNELSAVEHNVIIPIGKDDENVPRNLSASIEKAMKTAKVESLKSAKTNHEKEVKRKHIMLLDASIAYIAQGLKDGDIKRQLRDLPILISLRNELMEMDNKAGKSAIVYESIRVKEAKDNGGDVVEAMYEDARELQVILAALRNKNIDRKEIFGEVESS